VLSYTASQIRRRIGSHFRHFRRTQFHPSVALMIHAKTVQDIEIGFAPYDTLVTFDSAVPLFNPLVRMNHIPTKARVFGLHFCCRQYGPNFSRYDAVVSETYRFPRKIHKMTITSFTVIQCLRFGTDWKPVNATSYSLIGKESHKRTSYLALFSRYRELLIKLAGRTDGERETGRSHTRFKSISWRSARAASKTVLYLRPTSW